MSRYTNIAQHFPACIAFALLSGLPVLAACNPMPQSSVLSNVTNNRYLQVGVDAIASGLRTVTVSVEIGNESTLTKRINEVHFGMSLSGWTFIAQEVLTNDGNSSILLLTYGRRSP
jgi:hypothetical protein